MTLLAWEDFEYTEGSEDAVWVLQTVRYLVPRSGVGDIHSEDIWTLDITRSALAGEPVQCECGAVAVRYGERYVWGRDEYGLRDVNHRVPGQYCPRCDGGEDDP